MYKGRVEPAEGRSRRFRLLLFAALPDRVHAEVLGPLGAPQLIIDGGAGRLAVTFAREGESYVGAVRPSVLERILGVRVGLEELVRGLLTGETGDVEAGARELRRTGEQVPGLPQTLLIRSPEASLELELKRMRPLGADPTALGTGRPPAGTRERPLAELEDQGDRLEQAAGDGAAP